MDLDYDLQQQEIAVLKSIFADTFHQYMNQNEKYRETIRKSREAISYDPIEDPDCYFQMRIPVNLPENFKIKVKRSDIVNSNINYVTTTTTTSTTTTTTSIAHTLLGHKPPTVEEEVLSEYIEYAVVSLPRISLNFQYPQDYPQESAPMFQLSCSWLSVDQMELIASHLDALFEKGELVIFKYIDWIRDNVISSLQLTDGLVLTNDIQQDVNDEDTRCKWENEYNWVSLLSALPMILSNNSHESKKQFMQNSHTCPICYCDYPACEMTLLKCNHFLCNECLSSTCNINIESKNIQLLKCTEFDCPQIFDINTIQQAASADNFEKYQDLVKLSKGYTKCNHCGEGWAFIDVHTQSTLCPKCYYSACLGCQKAFHPGVPCADVGKIYNIPKHTLSVKRKDILKNINNDNQQQSQRVLEAIMENANTFDRDHKYCPGCNTLIFKIDGCNKVACTACNVKFCFLCCKVIQDYTHFNEANSVCPIFGGKPLVTTVFRKKDPTQQYVPKSDTGKMKCLRCASECYRYNYNNHLLCFTCKTEMCYQCKSVIKSKHYTTSPCKQHGDL
ncbi:hypothetical protein DLAC_05020 [Tieghemostelium lacteum]|uniref:RING-type domain-containing protein n=1 Tax=Tieghemostelium lacteum TaxID=361077 RepID=A0A151ZIA0_TIELA|nr:hypothetical protein DLAC_05020 [Tieghemostelium lacteum]|eukprot:KYQ93637.1 hypothetical protein DLAC_05020 [Tieghemostelium lacteum]